MLYSDLRERVCESNTKLGETGLVILTWGNVSEISEDGSVMAIKPSGATYKELKPETIVLINIASGEVFDSAWNPSSDTLTHLEIYRNFPAIRGITHTHSPYAIGWAQACEPIPALGTTHADCWFGSIPATRPLTEEEVVTDYELNTGRIITKYLQDEKIDPQVIPGILVSQHGPFTWGKSGRDSVEHALILEEIAKMAFITMTVAGKIAPIPQYLLDKHYLRKHGNQAYYGQKQRK